MIAQQAQQPPSLELRFQKLQVSYHWSLAVAIVAVIALAAGVLWSAYGAITFPNGEQAATRVVAAWSSTDATKLDAAYATDAVFVAADGTTHIGLAAIKSLHQQATSSGAFQAEIVGPIVQSGNTVVAPIRLNLGSSVEWVTSIFQLNSAGLVVHHEDYGGPMQ
jgi:SnoaL-like protein